MEQYIRETEENDNYLTYKGPKKIREPVATNQYNERFLYEGP